MFIPIGDDNSGRLRAPVIVVTLVLINAFVWYLQLTLGEPFTYGFAVVPFELTRGVDLAVSTQIQLPGGIERIPQFPGPSPIWLTIISSMFMHGSWGHILGNMLYLIIFGDQIEDRLGHLRFLLFYLICGVAASIAHIAIDPASTIPCLGASGAIAGVLGAYWVSHPRNRVKVIWFRPLQITHIPASVVLGGWIVIQLVSQISVIGGAGSGIAYMAHIGGFVAGIALLKLFPRADTIVR